LVQFRARLTKHIAGGNPLQRGSRYIKLARQRFDSISRWRGTAATVAVGFIAMLLAVHVLFGENGMLTYQRKRAESKQLQQEIERLQQENSKLTQHIRELKSDPKAIEREAREQLRYARPGEVIYTIPDVRSIPSTSTAKR
jgi:cell division protein FtsB